MATLFDHEKLRVYQEAIAFVAWWTDVAPRVPGTAAARDHMDRASTSVALNIAEGNGKRSVKDRCRYLDMARGSAYECAACLDVFVAKNTLAAANVEPGKRILLGIVSMLMGLIETLSSRPAD